MSSNYSNGNEINNYVQNIMQIILDFINRNSFIMILIKCECAWGKMSYRFTDFLKQCFLWPL